MPALGEKDKENGVISPWRAKMCEFCRRIFCDLKGEEAMRVLQSHRVAICAGAILVSAVLWVFSGECWAEGNCFSADPMFIQRDARAARMVTPGKSVSRGQPAVQVKGAGNLGQHLVAAPLAAKNLRRIPGWVKAFLIVFSGSTVLMAALILAGKRSRYPKR
jgi:hypothetical protein